HVRAQAYVQPGGERTIALELPGRTLRVRAVGSNATVVLAPRAAGPRQTGLVLGAAGWAGGGRGNFAPGAHRFRIRNAGGHAAVIVVEEEAWTETAATALLVTTMQEFRDLFSAEVLSPHHRVGVRNIALLFSDLKGS